LPKYIEVVKHVSASVSTIQTDHLRYGKNLGYGLNKRSERNQLVAWHKVCGFKAPKFQEPLSHK